MKLTIYALGRLKPSPFEEIFNLYLKRLSWPVHIKEIQGSSHVLKKEERQKRETDALFKQIPPRTYIFALDERGESLTSQAFAALLKTHQDQGQSMAFIIGGADGFSPSGREKANRILSFGAATWPHLLTRLMLIEQLYRAQQILTQHPYHRG